MAVIKADGFHVATIAKALPADHSLAVRPMQQRTYACTVARYFLREGMQRGMRFWIVLRWTAWTAAIIVFVLAPLAWSPVELLLRGWELFATHSPSWIQPSSECGGWLIAQVVELWVASEAFVQGALALLFIALFIYGALGGIVPDWLCAIMKRLGQLALFFALYLLSFWLWNGLDEVSLMVPSARAYALDLFAELTSGLSAGWSVSLYLLFVFFVFVYGLASTNYVRERLRQVQETLQSAFIGEVDPAFPRAPFATAERCARERRAAIKAYFNGNLPPDHHTQVLFSNAHSTHRFIREYVERRQEEVPVEPLRVVGFVEVPKGSAIKARSIILDTTEEVAGQYVRLKFESAQGPVGKDGKSPIDDTLMLLLARVVDAAILADQHLDGERRDQRWPAMPFFDRIYVENTPYIPPPFDCLLSSILGDAFPARVVIETPYPDVFRRALHGGKGKYGQFRNWFGIGIQIERPNLPQDFLSRILRLLNFATDPVRTERKPWFKADVVCRRLKSRVVGGVSGTLMLDFVLPDTPERGPKTEVHAVSSGPLADGCPSAIASLSADPPLIPRGEVANAPALWLLPPKPQLHESCFNICAHRVPPERATLCIDLGGVGKVQCAPSEIAPTFSGPRSVGGLRRKAWIGAFFDRDLRIGNRFPLAVCGALFDGTRSIDLRGAFAKYRKENAFAGVFVAERGPVYAPNLLLPASLLSDYLVHYFHEGVDHKLSASLSKSDEPPFVPSPEVKRAR